MSLARVPIRRATHVWQERRRRSRVLTSDGPAVKVKHIQYIVWVRAAVGVWLSACSPLSPSSVRSSRSQQWKTPAASTPPPPPSARADDASLGSKPPPYMQIRQLDWRVACVFSVPIGHCAERASRKVGAEGRRRAIRFILSGSRRVFSLILWNEYMLSTLHTQLVINARFLSLLW